MVKGAYIAIGFTLTIIALYILNAINALIDAEYFVYYFVFISVVMCLTTGIILIKKGYKNTGIGVISALICYYSFILMVYWMMQGPM